MNAARILVVEDERAIRLAIAGLLKKEGYDVELAESASAALSLLADEHRHFDLVLTDLALGQGGTGMDVLAGSKKTRGATPVVMITAHGNERIAVEAMKAGPKTTSPSRLITTSLDWSSKGAGTHAPRARASTFLIASSENMDSARLWIGAGDDARLRDDQEGCRDRSRRPDPRRSRTGKNSSLKRSIKASSRRERPFVAVNCAAISRGARRERAFGHERGAFTGLMPVALDGLRRCARGTIFLDEIGDMPPETQAKVLRVLQERQIERVGSQTPIPIEVRVVAATRNLEAEVAAEVASETISTIASRSSRLFFRRFGSGARHSCPRPAFPRPGCDSSQATREGAFGHGGGPPVTTGRETCASSRTSLSRPRYWLPPTDRVR